MSPTRRRGNDYLRLTDTTFRDANQTLLAGGLSGEEILQVAPKIDKVGFFALEAFGGATVESELSRHGENPFDYLRKLGKATPKTPIQALVRGQNLVAHRNFADDVVDLFISHLARCGVDLFRFFDPLNDLRNMERAIRAAKRAHKRVQGALCYAISPVHRLETWAQLARGLQKLGVDEIVIKDTSGLLSPQTAWELVGALKDVVKLPIAVHSHCSSGMAPMAYMAAVEAGASMLDTAMSPLAWGASQPAAESVVAALAGSDYDTGLDLDLLMSVTVDLEHLRRAHEQDLSPVADRVDADILRFHIPSTMLHDVHAQLQHHHAEDRLDEVLVEVAQVREEMGQPPLVAPIRQMIASQAVLNVVGGDRYATVTKELKDYLQGLYGRPPVPADSEIRRLVLGREEPITIRPADLLQPELPAARKQLERMGVKASDDNVLLHLLFPGLAGSFFKAETDGKAEKPPADEPEPAPEVAGEAAQEAAQTVDGEPEPEAAPLPAAAEFQVEVEGEVFTVRVTGAGMNVAPAAGQPVQPAQPDQQPAPRPAASGPGSVTAPMQGLIVKIPVKVGEQVALGDTVAVLEAMKMQNDISAPIAGRIQAIHVKEGEVVGPNQPILSIG